ncbi:MAG TPA: DUF3999 family protein [Acidobacteriota bacterium]|nr:DUF3999 family protein [Acidobacteriota bacterium]
MKIRTRLFALLTAALSLTLFSAEPLYVYHRDVTVAEVGWVRLNVPIEILGKLSSSTEEILVLDREGSAVPVYSYQKPPGKPSVTRTVKLSDIEHRGGGYFIQADLGPGEFRHRMVYIDIPGKGIAEGVVLQGSADGQSWHVLQKGSMFRLNYEGMTEKTSLEYAPTTDRYLKIFWPEAAGFPSWHSVSVADWTDKEVDLVVEDLPFRKAWGGDHERAYYLSLPPFPLERASLTLFPQMPYPVQCRLASFHGGSWDSVSETILLPDSSAGMVLPSPLFSGRSLVVLEGGGYAVKETVSMQVRYVPRRVVFKAERAGIFSLYYRALGGAPPPKPVEELKTPPERFVEASLGPELETSLPEIPPLSILLGGAMPATDFSVKREVRIPEGGPNLVSLELPADIYGYSKDDLSDIRLDCGGRQLPYILHSPPERNRVFEARACSPVPLKNEKRSVIEIRLPSERIPLAYLELQTPSQPFSRRVSLQYKRAGSLEDRVKEGWYDMGSSVWECPAAYGVMTRFVMGCRPVESRELRIVFDDMDNAPLQSVNAILWSSKDILVFPRPEGDKTLLCAGAGTLSKPVYDFERLRDIALTRKSVTASLAKGEPSGPGPEKKIKILGKEIPLSKWIFLFSILLVSVVIIVILMRNLKEIKRPD